VELTGFWWAKARRDLFHEDFVCPRCRSSSFFERFSFQGTQEGFHRRDRPLNAFFADHYCAVQEGRVRHLAVTPLGAAGWIAALTFFEAARLWR
jgi:hypothetical protein